MHNDRLDDERQFHNRAYGEDTRGSVRRFYAITRRSRRFYEDTLAAAAQTGHRALEYGCGPGTYARWLASLGLNVIGIDISTTAIDQARDANTSEAVRFYEMDAEHLAFPDRHFNVVCGTGILHHLDLKRAFAELARTMTDNGTGVFLEPLGHNPLINMFRRRTPDLRTATEHPLMMADIALAASYFGRVDTGFYHLLTLGAVPFAESFLFEPVLRVLESAERGLFGAIPVLRRFAWQAAIVVREPRRPTPVTQSAQPIAPSPRAE